MVFTVPSGSGVCVQLVSTTTSSSTTSPITLPNTRNLSLLLTVNLLVFCGFKSNPAAKPRKLSPAEQATSDDISEVTQFVMRRRGKAIHARRVGRPFPGKADNRTVAAPFLAQRNSRVNGSAFPLPTIRLETFGLVTTRGR